MAIRPTRPFWPSALMSVQQVADHIADERDLRSDQDLDHDAKGDQEKADFDDLAEPAFYSVKECHPSPSFVYLPPIGRLLSLWVVRGGRGVEETIWTTPWAYE